ncbi:methyltransferase domain-containing protein [Actinosynnema sp. NPDC047251]|uniref:Methyltransferase / FAD-dependent pyridine nucleotide-disulfide oxidoreductase n=1 Tax=Saccharothrix espanaensis (strain ATCC 51144 / DSM 44229 / JCM 9112 / NBRC 15066 / NRRL 15764) TaxID=1179773 RepID=K0K388_SACES|nr:bifunctional NAD(P)/FAD-dependent oxidoreductase/class I SAM-dependent methyltransferase [Saccharothrix espanaensis]CCH32776.1 Methyltransferase / FAD-dependent pyridine nucleotide-disulfide oxidoreductase [Saccharothrix espanaensis DSM 44229]
MTRKFDVAVLGGGAAGLSGAVALGRSRRSVVVVDAGAPRNASSHAVHGFLSRDGIGPRELVEAGRAEVERFGGLVLSGTAVAARRADDGFEVDLDDGGTVEARRLLVTTGLADELPDVPGVAQRWGRDVVHCPSCHGWELRDLPVGVLATHTEWAVRQALMFRQLASAVTFFQHTGPAVTEQQVAQLTAWGIEVVDGMVEALEVADDRLTGVRLAGGAVVACSAVVVAPRLVANSGVLADLGLAPTPHSQGIGESIAAGPTGLTETPGVWVAGNITDLSAQVVGAAAAGAAAGAAINADLVAEDTKLVSRLLSGDYWEQRYGTGERVWSGKVNRHVTTTAADLAPGTALDVGSGEGADAIWLAERGWKVTGVDLARTALDRAARQAAEAGVEVTWQQADVTAWDPAPEQFDLVSVQYLHLPGAVREDLYRRLAAAVRPGGTLLVVGHHPADLDVAELRRPRLPHLMSTAEQVAALLDPAEWDITASAPQRPATAPDGQPITLTDAVLRATRRAADRPR